MEADMKQTTRIFLAALLGVTLGASAPSMPANAQAFPGSDIVKLVVPFPPGGVVDITGRLLADQLQRTLPGTVIVENRPGAGGTLGAHRVARALPDGLTLLLGGAATHAFAPSIYKSVPYDPIKDFVPVTQVTAGPLVLVVNAASDVKNLDDFLRKMAARGNRTNYASNGTGTYPHLAVELLKQSAAFDATHVPYKGGAQAMTALLADEVDFSLNHIPVVLGQINAGRLRAIATAGEKRSAVFPDLPTLKEAGFDVVASPWFGLFAPAGTSPAIVSQLASATAQALSSEEVRQRMVSMGDEVAVHGPAAFAAFQAAELAKWSKVIKAAGVTAE
jgi:tripartite-type tricarboxylate transporter receptor subunit TctC